jgi:hypothetical protein
MRPRKAYKLFRVDRTGRLRSLFIGKTDILPIGEWLTARVIPTKGFAVRAGWHCTVEQTAPHLAIDPVGGMPRVWAEVECDGWIDYHNRPESQGGTWVTCQRMRIVRVFPRDGVVLDESLLELQSS